MSDATNTPQDENRSAADTPQGENGSDATDTPQDENKPDPKPIYMCLKCDASFQSEDTIRFCNKCGAQVKLIESGVIKKALVIDDSKLTRAKIGAILKSLGVQVSSAANGQDGLDIATKMKPDLIILDIEMPHMNGMEVLDIIRTQNKDNTTPIVMLTGHADVELVKKALTIGANDYVLKDKSVLEIANRIKKYL